MIVAIAFLVMTQIMEAIDLKTTKQSSPMTFEIKLNLDTFHDNPIIPLSDTIFLWRIYL